MTIGGTVATSQIREDSSWMTQPGMSQCVHTLFEAQAQNNPDAIALVFQQSQMTYRELNRLADERAQQLLSLGVGPDVLVALFLERSTDLVIAILAVLKAGGAYIPLDPAHPAKRLAHMMADARPLVVMTQRHLESKLPPHGAHILCIDDAIPSVQRLAQPSRRTVSPRDLAYVIYTSGSTGLPKGVEIEHGALANLMAAMQKRPGFDATDTILAITTMTFDMSVPEIFLPLVSGARMVIAPGETVRDGTALAALIERSGATFMQATPTTLRMLLDTGWRGAPKLNILCGGEAWTSALAAEVLGRCRTLWNMYGPTETTVWSAVARVEPNRPVVIGPVIDDTQFHILDPQLQPVPAGILGELYIGGGGLARGYHNRPELTAEKFIPNPFQPGTRLYKTGDLARALPNGDIEYQGRIDQQVKIRGFRIELGEIESALAAHPAIREAVVVAREDIPGNKQLVAYLTAREKNAPDSSVLRRLLAETLPDYMVPSAFVVLDRFPQTPSGKVDRNALLQMDPPSRQRGFVAPASSTQKTLTAIWEQIAGAKRVGLNDNFFELGGHSIMGIRLIDKINRTFGSTLTIADLFHGPTVENLARRIDDHLLTGNVSNSAYPAGIAEINRGTAGHPIFCLPGIGATAYAYHLLAGQMDTERPVLVVELHRLKVKTEIFRSMESIAQVVVQRMRQTQPAGPYTVMGYSFGGNLAVEVARQLIESGQTVETLLVLDAYGPGTLNRPSLLKRVAAHLRILEQTDLRGAVDYISTRIRNRLSLPENAIERQIEEVRRECEGAFNRHQPKVFDGRVTLIHATDLDDFMEVSNADGTFGWGPICKGGVEMMSVDCHHLDIFLEPHIAALAGHINTLLADGGQSRAGKAAAR